MFAVVFKFSGNTVRRLSRSGRAVLGLSQPVIIAILLGASLKVALPGATLLPIVGAVAAAVWGALLNRSLHRSLHDALTRLPNRILFLQRLEQAMRRANRQCDQQFAVFLLDLDRFRLVNETLGQTIGNQLLLALTDRLKALPIAATLARVGGNEFALWQQVHNANQAIHVANQLQALLTVPFNLGGQELCITVSIGIVLSGGEYGWSDDLLKDAQLAMYHAKSLGRSRYAVFQPSLRVQAVPLLQLESDLRRAIERQELRLHYQALVSLETGKIVGFEALVRWQHSQHGLLLPAKFVPIAEDNGLIAAVDRWALLTGCQQLSRWQQQFPTNPPLQISVNLSSHQFVQPGLIAYIEQVLAATNLAAGTLKLEITESVLLEDSDAVIATLEQMKALDVRLSIDDFGTGYSSLSYLYRFPTDTLKIDRSFITRIGQDSENDAIVRTIIALAHSLGMTVTAEGIETAAQLALLRHLHCESGQGFFFSRPLDYEATEALLAAAPQW
jgi:diguanylate cyclase (GGDEF)-like protein